MRHLYKFVRCIKYLSETRNSENYVLYINMLYKFRFSVKFPMNVDVWGISFHKKFIASSICTNGIICFNPTKNKFRYAFNGLHLRVKNKNTKKGRLYNFKNTLHNGKIDHEHHRLLSKISQIMILFNKLLLKRTSMYLIVKHCQLIGTLNKKNFMRHSYENKQNRR